MDGNFRKEVIDRSLDDIKVELDEEFDRNFERKSFFDEQKWPERKFDDGVGSLMQRTGGLRKSISSRKRAQNWRTLHTNHTDAFTTKAEK